jgi:hypothetical protein
MISTFAPTSIDYKGQKINLHPVTSNIRTSFFLNEHQNGLMSDSEVSNNVPNDEQTTQTKVEGSTNKKASGRAVMTEQKLENLARARAVRKANLDAKKYSKDKRGKAEERIEEEVKRRAREEAEKLAEELIKQRETERELKEYREWKKKQAELVKDGDADKPKPKNKKAAPPKPKAEPEKKKKAPRARKPKVESDSEDEEEYSQPAPRRARTQTRTFEEDWLANVLD